MSRRRKQLKPLPNDLEENLARFIYNIPIKEKSKQVPIFPIERHTPSQIKDLVTIMTRLLGMVDLDIKKLQSTLNKELVKRTKAVMGSTHSTTEDQKELTSSKFHDEVMSRLTINAGDVSLSYEELTILRSVAHYLLSTYVPRVVKSSLKKMKRETGFKAKGINGLFTLDRTLSEYLNANLQGVSLNCFSVEEGKWVSIPLLDVTEKNLGGETEQRVIDLERPMSLHLVRSLVNFVFRRDDRNLFSVTSRKTKGKGENLREFTDKHFVFDKYLVKGLMSGGGDNPLVGYIIEQREGLRENLPSLKTTKGKQPVQVKESEFVPAGKGLVLRGGKTYRVTDYPLLEDAFFYKYIPPNGKVIRNSKYDIIPILSPSNRVAYYRRDETLSKSDPDVIGTNNITSALMKGFLRPSEVEYSGKNFDVYKETKVYLGKEMAAQREVSRLMMNYLKGKGVNNDYLREIHIIRPSGGEDEGVHTYPRKFPDIIRLPMTEALQDQMNFSGYITSGDASAEDWLYSDFGMVLMKYLTSVQKTFIRKAGNGFEVVNTDIYVPDLWANNSSNGDTPNDKEDVALRLGEAILFTVTDVAQS